MDPFVGEIRPFAFKFAPRGWVLCDGRLLPVGQYGALFAVIGNVYGGDGTSTFAVPDLEGSAPLAWGDGRGSGAGQHPLGEKAGSAAVGLTEAQMPRHLHSLMVSTRPATARQPPGQLFASGSGTDLYDDDAPPYVELAPDFLKTAGSGKPHENMQPSLALTLCIAVEGVFPPRPPAD